MCCVKTREVKVVSMHAMRAYMEVEVVLHSFLNFTIGGHEWSALRRTKIPPVSAEKEAVWGSEQFPAIWRRRL